MRVLVTGGAGFIGSNLVRALLEGGHETAVLDDLSSGHLENIEPYRKQVRFVRGDVRNQDAVGEAMADAEWVFHLAAAVGNSRSIADPLSDSQVNVIGTLQVLQQARRVGVKRLVLASSAGIFGELRTLPISEDHPVEPDSPYGASKLCAEKQALAYTKVFALPCVALRYFNVYGVNQRYDAYGNAIPIFVHRILRGEGVTIFGDGEQTRDFANVHDVVRANLAAASSTAIGAFNIGSGTRISINRLVAMLFEVAGVEPRVEYGPLRKGDVRDSLADIRAAGRAFGYAPKVDLVEGLVEYVAWVRSQGLR